MGRAIASLQTADVFLPPKNQFFLAVAFYITHSVSPIVYFETDQTIVKYTFL